MSTRKLMPNPRAILWSLPLLLAVVGGPGRAQEPFSGEGLYQLLVAETARHLHENGWGDRIVSTRWQPDDDFTRFTVERPPENPYYVPPGYLLRVKQNGRALRFGDDRIVSTAGGYLLHLEFEQLEDGTYRLHDPTGDFLRVRGDGIAVLLSGSTAEPTSFHLRRLDPHPDLEAIGALVAAGAGGWAIVEPWQAFLDRWQAVESHLPRLAGKVLRHAVAAAEAALSTATERAAELGVWTPMVSDELDRARTALAAGEPFNPDPELVALRLLQARGRLIGAGDLSLYIDELEALLAVVTEDAAAARLELETAAASLEQLVGELSMHWDLLQLAASEVIG